MRKGWMLFLSMLVGYLPGSPLYADSPIGGELPLTQLDQYETVWIACERENDCEVISYGPGCYWLAAINSKAKADIEREAGNKWPEPCSLSWFEWLLNDVSCKESTCVLD